MQLNGNNRICDYQSSGRNVNLVTMNPETELTRNVLLLYPYILNQTISHGRAAEIQGIRKSELIDLYDKLWDIPKLMNDFGWKPIRSGRRSLSLRRR